MSGITGKNTSTAFRKKDVAESRLLSIGFKKIRFMHKAAAGDTLIQLASLTTPTEATANGFVQPSVSDLLKTDIYEFQENVELRSSLRGPLDQFLAYRITGPSTIKLLFEAEENEIFTGLIDLSARTGNTLVDAEPLVSTGSLAAGDTDYNVGTPFKVGMFPNAQHGAVMVFLDNQPVYRNSGNNPPGPGVDGEYYEVHAGGGLGTIIRFNTPDLVNDRNVSVISIGSLVERPNGSQLALVEALQGQVTTLREYVQALVGEEVTVPVSAPTNVDLKAFGDDVFTLKKILDLEVPIMTGWQASTVTTNVTTNTVISSKVRQVGDSLHYKVLIDWSGAPSAFSTLDLILPSNIDTTKLLSSTAAKEELHSSGTHFDPAGGTTKWVVKAFYQSENTVRVKHLIQVSGASTIVHIVDISNTTPFSIINGSFMEVNFIVPGVGLQATQTVRQALGL